MPTALLPGIGRLDAQRAGGEGHREVVRQRLDPADLDVRRRLDLVLGHDRAGVAPDDLRLDLEARELLDDDLLGPPVDRLLAARGDGLDGLVEEGVAGQGVLAQLARPRRVGGVGDVVRVADRAAAARRRPVAVAPGLVAAPGLPGRRERRRRRHRRGHRRGAVLAPDPGLPGEVGRARRRLAGHRAPGRRHAGPSRSPPVPLPPRASAARAARAPPARAACCPPRCRRPSAPRPSPAAASWLSRRLNAMRMPAIPRATSRTNAPSGVTRSDRPSAMNVPTSPPPAPRPGARRRDDRGRPEQPDVGDDHAEERQAPAGARRLARAPLDVPAGREEQERQQPAQAAEPRARRSAGTRSSPSPRPAGTR